MVIHVNSLNCIMGQLSKKRREGTVSPVGQIPGTCTHQILIKWHINGVLWLMAFLATYKQTITFYQEKSKKELVTAKVKHLSRRATVAIQGGTQMHACRTARKLRAHVWWRWCWFWGCLSYPLRACSSFAESCALRGCVQSDYESHAQVQRTEYDFCWHWLGFSDSSCSKKYGTKEALATVTENGKDDLRMGSSFCLNLLALRWRFDDEAQPRLKWKQTESLQNLVEMTAILAFALVTDRHSLGPRQSFRYSVQRCFGNRTI